MLRKVLDRESCVKSNLIKRLIDCVKELQFRYAADKGAPLVNDEATNLLCWILEAVFIHGLKNPFFKSMTSVFQNRQSMIPEPSFWEFVLIYCHQDVIVQINKLSFISSDVGRCRAWLRLALNDALFISYLQMMLKDKGTIREYYKPSAFLRDPEKCDMLKSYLYGIESYDFQLACNSSLLNTWNSGPLSLVGLWTSTSPSDWITQGVDVAENMDSRDLQVLPSLSQSGRNSPGGSLPMRPPLLEEEEALRYILASKPNNPGSSRSSRKSSNSTPPKEAAYFGSHEERSFVRQSAEVIKVSTAKVTAAPPLPPVTQVQVPLGVQVQVPPRVQVQVPPGVQVQVRPAIQVQLPPTESSDSTQADNEQANEADRLKFHEVPQSVEKQEPKVKPKNEATDENLGSYTDLLNTYNQNIPVGTPITSNYMESIFSGLGLKDEENRSLSPTSPGVDQQLGFEVLSILSSSGNYSEMLPQVHSYLQRIPNEVGLDAQNYRCKNCDRPVGMIYGAAKLCALSGNYFCHECHVSDESVIPSRIMLNWDFSRYSVSKPGKQFLQDIYEQPLFDLSKINNLIYKEIEECEEIRVLRSKLQPIALYLRTCKEPVMEEVLKDLWPKEHLYEEIHMYSLADLLNIPSGSLATSLNKLVNFGKSHVLSCKVCQQKGFVCEICKDPQVIFPFELEKTYKCLSCGAVYHAKCMSNKLPCPRCERWKGADEDDF